VLEGLSANTLKNFRTAINKLMIAGFMPADLSKQSNADKVNLFVNSGPKSQENNTMKAIKKILRVCYPSSNVVFYKPKKSVRSKEPPSPSELLNLIKSMIKNNDIHLACSALFLLSTGLRINDARRINICDFGKKQLHKRI
jgi:integrase